MVWEVALGTLGLAWIGLDRIGLDSVMHVRAVAALYTDVTSNARALTVRLYLAVT